MARHPTAQSPRDGDPASPSANGESNGAAGDDTTSTPRWVKVFGIIALIVVLLFVIVLFTRGPGGRGHGPSRHFGGQAP